MNTQEVIVKRKNHIGNPSNPLGLMRTIDGRTWQLVAYFHYNDKSEVYSKTKKHLSVNRTTDWISSTLVPTDEPKINYQLRHHFPKTWRRYRAETAGYGIMLLFKRYDGLLTLSEAKHVSKNHMQATMDYYTNNKTLPLLITDNLLFDLLHNRLIDGKQLTERSQSIEVDHMKRLFGFHNIEKRIVKVKKDNDDVAFYNDVEQEKMQTIALLKGGFVDFKINNKDYSLPTLPLIALTNLSECLDFSYELGLYTWFFDEKLDLEESVLETIFLISNIDPKLKKDKTFIQVLKDKSFLIQNKNINI